MHRIYIRHVIISYWKKQRENLEDKAVSLPVLIAIVYTSAVPTNRVGHRTF